MFERRNKNIKKGSYSTYLKLREWQGFKSDASVAKELGLRRAFFSEWKNGIAHPNPDKLSKISQLFGVSIEDLLEDT